MGNTVRLFLILLAAAACVNLGAADERKPKTDFGFDPATIPPCPEGSGNIARCYLRNIALADLPAKALPLDEEAVDQLRGLILREICRRIAAQEKLEAKPAEVEAFYRVLLNQRIDAKDLQGDLPKNPKTMVGAMFVRGWKIDRLLYKRYGGTVIFQQGNPREPVGAYRQLLEEAERAKVFEIYDPASRKAFWEYFIRESEREGVSPEEINYEKPWWLQEPG